MNYSLLLFFVKKNLFDLSKEKNGKNFSCKLLIPLVTLLVATGGYAIPPGPCDIPKDVCCKEPEPGSFAFTYSKDIGLSCPNDFYLYGDLLLIQSKEDGLEIGITNGSSGDPNLLPIIGGNILGFSSNCHDWEWDLGFRIGAGFYLDHDTWCIELAWTYVRIKNTASHKLSSEVRKVIVPFWIPPEWMVPQ